MNVSALYLVICEWLSQILVAMEPVFLCSTGNPSVGLLQACTWIHVGWSSMKGGPLNFGNSTRMKVGNSSCGDFPLEQIISMTFPAVPLNCSNFTKHQLIVVVRRTLADLHTYNVRMRPPAVSADEVLAWIPWHSAVIFAIGKSLFAKKNCALLCSHSSACVGKANRAFFAM